MIDLKTGEKLASKKNRFKTKNVEIEEGVCFSIIFKNHSTPLDLLAEDTDTVSKWVSGLCIDFTNTTSLNLYI